MPADRDEKLEDKGEKAVEDVIDFFEEGGDDDSPTSDAAAPPPG
jgi:hypothetical protein